MLGTNSTSLNDSNINSFDANGGSSGDPSTGTSSGSSEEGSGSYHSEAPNFGSEEKNMTTSINHPSNSRTSSLRDDEELGPRRRSSMVFDEESDEDY